ncbi:DUF3348 family protein [Piscinibacter gummiphilus]|uniref:DUF3348 family protein n=1 Tax=Piscinibacter gummiphilus TaxID=946333 RepID=A0ABZ0CXQ8_9BURK|nr:DUF3348 family protein [Piscinibacter gummiphilus]WOB09753.1 DUF3348 family protein [Piscinibacter gummiphilus]
MQHGSFPAGVAGSELTRLLARLAETPPPDTAPAFAEGLGRWLGWADAVSLSTALSTDLGRVDAGPASGASGLEEADFHRVRAALAASIAKGPDDDASSPADFSPYRRHCHAQQQAMQNAIAALRQRLRDALSRRSPALAKLAAIDAVMDRALSAQERTLLGLVPLRLQSHFERMARAARSADRSGGDSTDDTRWTDAFRQDMERVLLAELSHRLMPAQGLLDSLHPLPQTP